jgi:hypothetical protein
MGFYTLVSIPSGGQGTTVGLNSNQFYAEDKEDIIWVEEENSIGSIFFIFP